MTELKATREHLYTMMGRATAIFEEASYEVRVEFLRSAVWARYKVLEERATDERDPATLLALVEQMDSTLDGFTG